MRRRPVAVAIAVALWSAALSADTLVLRDGKRIRGELVGVSGRDIEFEERSGRDARVLRVPRRDIERIEFDAPSFFDSRRDDRGGAAAPRGMRERSVSVAADQQWTDTGIDVRAGQELYLSASGQVRWGPGRRDDAAGERNSPQNPGRPMPNRPGAALIGRVGDRDEPFFIGDDPGPFRVRSSGRLYLGINDDVLTDNSGAFRVEVQF
jgi:hypothetical protein